MMTHSPITLKQALKVERLHNQSYKAVIPLDHCYDILAHGGFQISLVLTAIHEAFKQDFTTVDQPHTIDMHLTFLRPTLSGDVHIDIQDAKLGSNTSTFRFTLSQRGKSCLTGFACNAHLSNKRGMTLPTRFSLRPPPAPVDFQKLPLNQDPNWVAFHNEWFPECTYKGSTHTKMFFPIHGTVHPAVMEFWSCPSPDQDNFSNEMLGSFIDTYPRMIESMRDQGTSEWALKAIVERALRERHGELREEPIGDIDLTYPTLSITLEQKKLLPPEGARWLYMRAETKRVINGRFDVEIVVCDEHMDVVALSHQVNLIANVFKRRKDASAGTNSSHNKGKL